ncbi:hypothetical protein ACFXKY_15720 [Streptomyces canus]|uniref:hypothetical protein n=1 Tax=Streptomyces canus TaxID=58343 RepID=UPI0036CE84E9
MAGDRFTQISNALFRDPRITFKAKGIFGLISTHREGFGLSIRSIASFAKESKDAVGTGLKELEKYGYLTREPQYEQGKFAGYVYRITDMPAHLFDLYGDNAPELPEQRRTDASEPSPCPGNPDTVPRPDFPDAGNPNPDHTDPDGPDTKKTKHKKIKNEEHQDEAPSARSAADVRRTGAGSSARAHGGSAAKTKKPGPTSEQRAAIRAVEAALPRPLLAQLPGQRIPGNNHHAVLAALDARTPEQIAGRIGRRWVGWGFEPAFYDGLIRNPIGAAMALIAPTPYCPDPSCEDGVMVDTGAECRACLERRANRRAAYNRGEDPRRPPGATAPRAECVDCGRPLLGDLPDDGMCRRCRTAPADAITALMARWAAEDAARAETEALHAEAPRRRAQRAANPQPTDQHGNAPI